MSAFAWIGRIDGRGEVVERAAVPVDERGFLCGEGLFETMRAVPREGAVRVPLLGLHLERLSAGAARFGWASPAGPMIERAIATLFAASCRGDEVVRLTLSAAGDGPRLLLTTRPRVVRDRPLKLAVVRARRSPADPTATMKTTSRAFWALAQAEAEALGADEAVVLSTEGTLAETTTGNLFLRVAGVLSTPALDGAFLPGVARRVVIEALGDAVVERPLPAAELDRAAAIWVTNAVHGARPAVLVHGGPEAPTDDPLGEAFWRRLQCGAPKCR